MCREEIQVLQSPLYSLVLQVEGLMFSPMNARGAEIY